MFFHVKLIVIINTCLKAAIAKQRHCCSYVSFLVNNFGVLAKKILFSFYLYLQRMTPPFTSTFFKLQWQRHFSANFYNHRLVNSNWCIDYGLIEPLNRKLCGCHFFTLFIHLIVIQDNINSPGTNPMRNDDFRYLNKYPASFIH